MNGLKQGDKFTLRELGNCFIDSLKIEGDKVVEAHATANP